MRVLRASVRTVCAVPMLVALCLAPGAAWGAFPPTIEIAGTISDPDGDRPLADFVPDAFLFDHATDEASFVLELRATEHPDSTAELAIAIETHWSSEGSSAGCQGTRLRIDLDVEFEILESTTVVEKKTVSGAEETYVETAASFYYETSVGGSSTGCLADDTSRTEAWAWPRSRRSTTPTDDTSTTRRDSPRDRPIRPSSPSRSVRRNCRRASRARTWSTAPATS